MISADLKFRLMIRYIELSTDYFILNELSTVSMSIMTMENKEVIQNAYTAKGKYLIEREYGSIV